MAANPNQVTAWMEELASLPKQDHATLEKAVWYSDTSAGKAWLIDHDAAELANGPRPVVLADRQAKQLRPHHLDQLWEWFFATGEEEPVLKIVSLFSLAHELPQEGSLKLLSPPKKSGNKAQDKIQRYNYTLLGPALWSSTSLAIHHDRVFEILSKSHETNAHPRVKAWLGQVTKIARTEREKRSK